MAKKILKFLLIPIAALLIGSLTYVAIKFPPIMSGIAAKTMCSCVHVLGRSPESVIEKEYSVFPGLSGAKIEFIDSTAVTARLFFHTSKAIYRKGLGCTLLAQRTEEEVRSQQIALPSPPSMNQDSLAWPTGNILPDSILAGVNYAAIKQAIADAFAETDPRKPKNTLAVVAVYKGLIVGERYADGFNHNSMFSGWSMTKSMTNSLVGLLVKDGRLALEQPALVSEWANDERKAITLNDLMHASSGLEWNESYFGPGDFHNMFTHSDDKGGYAASKDLIHEPGEYFEYSSGTTNLLSKIVRQTVGDSAYYKFPYERLFYKIGMLHTLIEPDPSGTFVGSSYGFASARDWARFGLLFLNDGVWNGERILPEGWSSYSSTPTTATHGVKGEPHEYGAQWWLNAGARTNAKTSHNPGLPADEYGAEGFEEQSVFIIPSKNLVVVRLGISHHGFDIVGLTQKIIEALPQRD